MLSSRRLLLQNNLQRQWLPASSSRLRTPQTRGLAVKAKKPPGTPVNADMGRDRNLELILSALNAPTRVEPAIETTEQVRRSMVGRNHVIGRFQQHNEIHHDLACKIQLKKHAVQMMPRNSKLKEEALKVDGVGPPLWRHIAKWTPPIANFDPSEFVDRDD